MNPPKIVILPQKIIKKFNIIFLTGYFLQSSVSKEKVIHRPVLFLLFPLKNSVEHIIIKKKKYFLSPFGRKSTADEKFVSKIYIQRKGRWFEERFQ